MLSTSHLVFKLNKNYGLRRDGYIGLIQFELVWIGLNWSDLMWHGFHSYTVERCVGLRSLNLSSCRWLYYLLLFSSKIINFIALHRKSHWKITTRVWFLFSHVLMFFFQAFYNFSWFILLFGIEKKYQSSGIILSMKVQNSASPILDLIPLSLHAPTQSFAPIAPYYLSTG